MKSPLLYLGVALIMVLCTALIAPMFIDWSNYRSELERYGSKVAGRQLEIWGAVRIRILPTPVISVEDVRIANVEGASADSFVSAENVEMRLALSPLLQGQIKVESLEFIGATIELERMAEEGGNWHLSPEGGWSEFLSAESIRVDSAIITDSTIVLRDRARGGVARLEDVELEISAISLAGPYRIRGEVRHEDQPLAVAIQTGRRSTNGEMRLGVSLSPQGEYVPTYGFDGKLIGSGPDTKLEGKLRISRDLPTLVEDALPLDPAEVGLPFAFKSNVRADFSKIAFDDVELQVDQAQPGSVITGAMTVALEDTLDLELAMDARHLDLDRLAQRSGLGAGAFVPGLALSDTIAAALKTSPENIRGAFRLSVNALTIGGDTIESAEFAAELSGRELTVKRVAAVLPGRSELEVTDLRLTAREGSQGFEGNLRLATRDTRGFLFWSAPRLKSWLDAAPRGLKGKSVLTGQLALDGRSIGVRHAELKVDDMITTGAVLLVPGDTPEIFGTLAVDQINFDRYLPPATAVAASERSDPFATVFAGFDPEALSAFNGKLTLRTGPFERWRLQGDALNASLEIADGRLTLNKVLATNFHGADIYLDGNVNWETGHPHGRIGAKLETDDPARLLDMGMVRRLLSFDRREARRILNRLAPASVRMQLTSVPGKNGSTLTASLDGVGGGNAISVKSAFAGKWDEFRAGDLKLDGSIKSDRSSQLFGLLGLGTANASSVRDEPAKAEVALAGSLDKDVNTTVKVAAYGAEFDASGLLDETDGTLGIRSEIALHTDDSSGILAALGGVPDQEGQAQTALSLKGLIMGNGNEISVSGLGGVVGGVAVGLDGTVTLTGERPRLQGNLTVGAIDLPWVIARIVSLPGSAAEDEPSQVWTAEPFGFDLLRLADLQLSVQAGDVKLLGGAMVTQLKSQVVLDAGVLSIDGFEGGYADGELTFDARVAEERGQLSIEGQFGVSNAELNVTLGASQSDKPLNGRYSLEGQFKGAGRSPVGFVSSLTGGGTLRIQQAALRGVNAGPLSTALLEVTSADEVDQLLDNVLVDGEMDFSGLTSTFELENGVVRFTQADIDGPEVTGAVRGQIDLPAWRMDSKWTLGLKQYPKAPPLTVSLAGPFGEPARRYDTAALRSFFVVKGLTEGVARLEELQRQEEERIARLEEMERRARIDAARREEELLNAPEPGLLAPEQPKPDPEQSQADTPADADDARLVRTEPEALEEPSSTQSIESLPIIELEEAPVAPELPVPEQAIPELAEPEQPSSVARTDPDPEAVEAIPLPEAAQPLQPVPSLQPYNDQAGDDLDALLLEQQTSDAPVEEDPLIITPRQTAPRVQRNRGVVEDPSSWRK